MCMKIQSIESLQALADLYVKEARLTARLHTLIPAHRWGDSRDELMQLIEDLNEILPVTRQKRCDLLFGGSGSTSPNMYLVYYAVS